MADTPEPVHWTDQERYALVEAVAHACDCQQTASGNVQKVCEPHKMLLADPKTVKRLVSVRRWRISRRPHEDGRRVRRAGER